jgi:hypothetical protein
MSRPRYRAVVSADWSECLSPNGPFDPIAFAYPELTLELSHIFKSYTGNVISLDQAVSTIKRLMASDLSREQMDAYLDASFKTYSGVPELVEWCLSNDILFMINTTSSQGYFQRAMAKGLLPAVSVVAANPIIRFSDEDKGERYRYAVLEIEDKARNTEEVIQSLNLPGRKLVVIGDSGGDGPHFQWAARFGGFLIGSMIKQSLLTYCSSREVFIDKLFGIVYAPDEPRDADREMSFNFIQLSEVIAETIDLAL